MKKLLLLLLIAPVIGFGQSRDLKKAIKKLGNVEITNKGLNLSDDFVIFIKDDLCQGNKQTCESNWEKAFFKLGLNTSDWYVEDKTNIIDGRYKVEILLKSIIIKDANNNFKTVAIIEWSGKMSGLHSTSNDKPKLARPYLIQQLINSNK
tara:strand:+ start:62 stop:511 length:450 start_codon:yes stop_codon:yes gene_type:complete